MKTYKTAAGTKIFKNTTADSSVEADQIANKLSKQGFKVTIEPKYFGGKLVWFNVTGMKEIRPEIDITNSAKLWNASH